MRRSGWPAYSRPKRPLHAEPTAVRKRLPGRRHADDRIVPDLDGQAAPDPAEGTDGVDGLPLAAGVGDLSRVALRAERARRADGQAFPARDAGGPPHGVVQIERDPCPESAAREADDAVSLKFPARADAPAAENACLAADGNDGAGMIGRPGRPFRKARGRDARLGGDLLDLAGRFSRLDTAVRGMIRKPQLENRRADAPDFL